MVRESRSPMESVTSSLAIECRGLSRRYGAVKAVDGLDLAVRHGECFGLLGPNGAGKTTLAEALLWKTGVIGAAGSTERGSTVADFDPLEKTYGHSLNSSIVNFPYKGIHVHLIDTPGMPDFAGQSIAGQPQHTIARKGIARTFQSLRLFLNMSVIENVIGWPFLVHLPPVLV